MRFFVLALCLAGVLGSAAASVSASTTRAGSPQANAAKQSITLRLGDVLPSSDAGTVALEYFANLVKKYTKGQVTVQVYPNGQLTHETDIVTALRTGTVDLGIASVSFWTTLLPGIDALAWPYQVSTWPQAKAIADNAKINAYKRVLFAKEGVVYLGDFPYGWKELIGTKKVSSVSDMKGLTIRTGGGTGTAFLPTLGANAPVLDNSEVYQGLVTHTIDAANISANQTVSLKLYEVAKYYTEYNLYMIWLPLFINANSWQKLTSAQQAALTRAAQKMADTYIAASKGREIQLSNLLKANGVTITQIANFAPWRRAVQSAITKKAASSGIARTLLAMAAKAEKSVGAKPAKSATKKHKKKHTK